MGDLDDGPEQKPLEEEVVETGYPEIIASEAFRPHNFT